MEKESTTAPAKPTSLTVAPLTDAEEEQVNRVINNCIAFEEYLAATGSFLRSGTVASARQAIRFLASRLVAPEPEKKPEEKSE